MVLFVIVFDNRSDDDNGTIKSFPHGSSQLSVFDMRKAFAETFCQKVSKHAPLMLFETGDDRGCLLSFAGDPIQVFEERLKGIIPCSSDGGGLNFPITNAFTIVNKYRIKNGTDKFGHGRLPWAIEQVHIVIFTSRSSERITVGKTPGTGGDLVIDAYRWDHKVSTVLLDLEGTGSRIESTSGSLLEIATTTGGFFWRCDSFRDFQEKLELSYESLLLPSLGVIIDNENNAHAGSLSRVSSSEKFCRMTVRGIGEWPLPESYWVDSRLDVLPARRPHPTLRVINSVPISGKSSSNEIARAAFAFASEHEIHFDVYDICVPSVLDNLSVFESVHRSLACAKDDMLLVIVQGSGRVVDNGALHLGDGPCAILRPGSKVNSSELCVFPYNFPILFQLLKNAADLKNAENFTSKASLVEGLSVEFQRYLLGLPPYYLTSLYQLLQRLGFHPLLRKIDEFKLSKNITRMIARFQENAANDTQAMEFIAKEKLRCASHPSAADIASASNYSCGQLAIWEVPKTISQIAVSEMLSYWERMRRAIYGGPSGRACRGVAVVNVNPTGSVVSCNPANGKKSEWFSTACGAKMCPQTSQSSSGNYLDVLARREALRDPLLEMPPPDEDTPKERLKRKLTVNFGNRFGKSKRISHVEPARQRSSVSVIDPYIESSVGIKQSGLEVPTADVDEILAELLQDTPIPKREVLDDDADILLNAPQFVLGTPIRPIGRLPPIGSPSKRKIPRPTLNKQVAKVTASCSIDNDSTHNDEITVAAPDEATAKLVKVEVTTIPPSGGGPPTDRALPAGWVKCYSQRESREYWFNNVTGKSVWECPTE